MEISCGDCGYNYMPEEFKELKARLEQDAASEPDRPKDASHCAPS